MMPRLTKEITSPKDKKKFNQRLKYRLDLGYSYDQALRLACAKEFIKNPSLHLLPYLALDENLSASIPISDVDRPTLGDQHNYKYDPREMLTTNGRYSSAEQNSIVASLSVVPTEEEIRLEVEKLKLAGFMTEVPARTTFVSSAETVSSQSSFSSSDRLKPEIASPTSLGNSRIPYWTVSTLACCWLVYSMTTSLPGHWFWNLHIAVAFEFTPMLMLGARVDEKYQNKVFAGAIAIFLVGLGLYLAPSIQMLVNESSAYVEASARYDVDVRDYQLRSANVVALVAAAKMDADRSAQSYEDALQAYGEKSWRTAAAKKQKVLDAAEWKRQSSISEIGNAPIAPKISDDLTKAAQAIATRIGLFAAVFLSMFVMRRLEGPTRA